MEDIMSLVTVKTKCGEIEGIEKEGYVVFKGIPYAKPPVGNLRFAKPEKLDPWKGILKADTFKAKPMQKEHTPNDLYYKEFYSNPEFVPPASEDCLYMNIWTPAESIDEKLPVALWIYGGAFMGGYSSKIEFDGEAYAKRGVILVNFNYRVGVFGFMGHPWLSEESLDGTTGNYGIYDQLAALKWVHENIAAFGGDPECITVFGQSAGAMSTQTLISSPLTKGLIKRAIMQSGGGYGTALSTDKKMEHLFEMGHLVAEACGAKKAEDLHQMSTEKIMIAVDIAMEQFFKKGNRHLPFTPVIDGVLLPYGYKETLDMGLEPDIPYMLGSTANDMMVTPDAAGIPDKSILHKNCIAWSLHEEESGRNPSFIYYFNRQMPGDQSGAFHSSELWYMMGTYTRCWRPLTKEDQLLSYKMLEYWTNFIKSGNPNDKSLPEWKPCTKSNPFYMTFDIEEQ